MKFLKNIQFNYYKKLLESSYGENNLIELKRNLLDLKKKDKQLFYQFANKYLKEIIHNYNFDNLFNKKIIWLNSFNKNDLSKIISFLNFYLPSHLSSNFQILDYTDLVSQISSDYDLLTDKKLNFENFISNNLFYQFLISERKEDIVFLINNCAFFEQKEIKNYFTFTNLCLSYIYVVNNPYHIFSEYVSKHKVEKDQALNSIFNLDQNSNYKIVEGNEIIEPAHSWNVNVQSWSGNNVLNTFNGYLLKKELIYESGIDVFSEIIAHLNQAGLEIDLNYEKINEFIDESIVDEKIAETPESISNKVRKVFHRECSEMAKKFDYDI